MDRLFLDANVLFSAAYKPGSRLLELWARGDVQLVSSAYAVEEACRNLGRARPQRLADLEGLLRSVLLVPQPHADAPSPEAPDLVDKDRPILSAAIAARATHLLTGDKEHFGALMGRAVGGVLVLIPSAYLLEAGAGR